MYDAIAKQSDLPVEDECRRKECRIEIGPVIREFRKNQGRTACELARSSGIDPRTYGAIETGRIKNPSLGNLRSIAKALNVTTASFFLAAEENAENSILCFGGQKGEFTLDFRAKGFRLISLIPLIPDFFIGRMVLSANARLVEPGGNKNGRVFLQCVLGRFVVKVLGEEFVLNEGNHLMLNGSIPHIFENPSLYDATFVLVTVPSFLAFPSRRM